MKDNEINSIFLNCKKLIDRLCIFKHDKRIFNNN